MMTLYNRLIKRLRHSVASSAAWPSDVTQLWFKELCHLIEDDKKDLAETITDQTLVKAGLARYGTLVTEVAKVKLDKVQESKMELVKKAIHEVFRDTSITPQMSYNRAQLIIAHVHEYIEALLECFPELDKGNKLENG